MITLVRLGREFGHAQLATAVAQALDLGCGDVAAIRHLLMSDQLRHSVAETIEIGALSAYERPLPTMPRILCIGLAYVQPGRCPNSPPQAYT
jgi:hypothetical protein